MDQLCQRIVKQDIQLILQQEIVDLGNSGTVRLQSLWSTFEIRLELDSTGK